MTDAEFLRSCGMRPDPPAIPLRVVELRPLPVPTWNGERWVHPGDDEEIRPDFSWIREVTWGRDA